MKDKKFIYPIILLIIGFILIGLAFAGKVDEFWNGMGSALAVIGIIRILRTVRLNKSESYREKVEIAATDERSQFIRARAWSWAGYLFIIIAALAVIFFKIAGQELLSLAASWAVCLLLILYWGAYLLLRKKY